MNLGHINILLADDDADDRLIFEKALKGFLITTNLTTVDDGEKLINLLQNSKELPHVVFLDFNMPCKNGLECLKEIKQNTNLKHLPVIVYSTSFENGVIDELFENGAQFFIRKLADFSIFKNAIHEALFLVAQGDNPIPTREEFVLTTKNNLKAKEL